MLSLWRKSWDKMKRIIRISNINYWNGLVFFLIGVGCVVLLNMFTTSVLLSFFLLVLFIIVGEVFSHEVMVVRIEKNQISISYKHFIKQEEYKKMQFQLADVADSLYYFSSLYEDNIYLLTDGRKVRITRYSYYSNSKEFLEFDCLMQTAIKTNKKHLGD